MSEDVKLAKILGNKDVLALAFGAMIGWGWVVTAGIWVMNAGSLGAILAFLIGGALVAVVGLTYAELAPALPLAGGEFVYSFKALGQKASFITTWALILGYVSVIAFETVALPTVFGYLIPNYSQGSMYTVAGWDVKATWAGIGILGSLIITWINYRGIKFSTAIMSVLTFLIVLAGLLLITGSTFGGDAVNMEPMFGKGMAGLLSVVIMTPFMFVGFGVIPQASEEINLPARRIGVLLLFSVLLALVWYVLIILGVSRILTPSELADSDLVTADAMAVAYGHSRLMGKILVLGGIGGIITSWIGFYVGGSRAIYALARAGLIPKGLGDLHPKYRTPYKAILLISVLSTGAPLLGRPALVWLVNSGGLALVVAWLMVTISFLVLRKREPNLVRPFRLKAGVPIGWAAVIMCFAVGALYMPGMPSALVWPYEWLIVIGWALLGLVFYTLTVTRETTAAAQAHMQRELDRVVGYTDETARSRSQTAIEDEADQPVSII